MTLRALGTVLRAAWRRPSGLEALALGGALVGLTVASVSQGRPLGANAHVLLSLLLTLVGQHLVQGVTRQNHPHLARLMPNQRRALLAAVRVIGLVTLLATLAVWQLLAPDERPVMLFVAPLVLWLSACLNMGRSGSALVLPALSVGALVLAREAGWPKTDALWAGAALGAAFLLLVMPLLMRRGDAGHAAHWRRQRSTEAVLAVSLEGGKLGALQGQGWLSRLMRWWLWPTRRLLRGAVAPVRSADEALRRALWVVNPSLHLAQQGWMLLIVGLPVIAAGVLPTVWRSTGQDAGAAWGQGLIVGLTMWFFALNLGGSLTEHWSTRGEQALLRLLPGLPQGPALQRGWARVLRRHAWGGWALHAGLALAGAVAWQPSAWPQAVAAVLLSAPTAWLLPQVRWPQQVAPRSSWMNWATACAGASALVATTPWTGLPVLGALTPMVWIGAALLAWRWRRRPPATPWPVGHAGAHGA